MLGETIKAHDRRVKEGWFEKYVDFDKPGIDIGCQHNPLHDSFRKWDIIFGDGDATFMEGVEENSYQTVYASHVLEHLDDPVLAIQNWYKITSPGGNLIILVPHRDLYEKKKNLPSKWNFEHKSFWLPETGEAPDTYGFKEIILKAIPDADIVSFEVLQNGWEPLPANQHSVGEYSIEAIIKKPQ